MLMTDPRRHSQEGPVPLSDHEQRLLEQMERALYAEDPKFATTMRGADLRRRYRRRAVAAAFVFVIGIVLLMTGAQVDGLQAIRLGDGGTAWRRDETLGEEPALLLGSGRATLCPAGVRWGVGRLGPSATL